jgi:ABC-type glycerol-3-phosphate transport system substrate-binding protein
MKDRSKKPISRRQFLISGSLLASATLAACAAPAAPAATTAPAAGGDAAPAAEATQAPAEGAAAEAPTPAPEPTVAVASFGAGGTPIVVWHGLGGADGAVFANMLKDYSEKEGKAIESQTYDWNVFFQKYPTAVAAGTPPDWAIFHAAEVPQMASQGLMMPVDDIMAANSIPKDDFGKTVMDAVTVEGKTMCVPFDNHGWNCYVNTSLMEGTGFSAESMPKNADEFVQFALKATVDEAGKHPDESGFNPDQTKVWALHSSWQRFTMPSTWFQYHGGKGGQYDAENNKAILNSDKSVAAIQFWHDLMYKHRVVPPALPGQVGAYDLYKTNSLAIMWDGTWSLQFFKDNPDVEKVTKAVTMNSLAPDGVGGQKIDSHIMSIPTGAKQEQIDRAVPLITWLSNNGKVWATSGQIPARLSVQQDPDVQAIWSVKAASDAFAKQGYTETPHKAFIELQTAWETAVGAALANTTPLKESMDAGNAQIQSILDRG